MFLNFPAERMTKTKVTRLTDDESERIAAINRLIWQIARAGTPNNFRHNEWAIEESYDALMRFVVYAIRKYDNTRSAVTTYIAKYGAKRVRQYWAIRSNKIANRLRSCSLNSVNRDTDTELIETIPDTIREAPDQTDRFAIRQSVQQLPERARRMISSHFGLDDGSPMTLQSVADLYGYSLNYTQLLISESLAKLREIMQGGA